MRPQRPEFGLRRFPPAAVLLALLAAMGGCSPFYVARAGYEEARILWGRTPIESLLASDAYDAEERAKLALVLEARDFAATSIGLNAAGSYASLSRNDDAAVVHVVSAAERFRLRPYLWWFPVVGRVPYKGFFDLERAQRAAKRLEDDGYDTYVRPAGGFSTLGWFDDPLLSSQLRFPRADLVNLVLHELLHSTSYTPGQAAFAESFATFVGYRGTIAFFAARGEHGEAAKVADEWHDTVAFSAFLATVTHRLEAAYARGVTLEERARLFHEIQVDWEATPQRTNRYAGFGRRMLNNAILLQLLVYHRGLGAFDDALQLHDGDLAATVSAIIAATAAGGDAFAALDGLRAARAAERSGSGFEGAQPIDAEAAGDDERRDAQRRSDE
jgi:predicted aminopeptidase